MHRAACLYYPYYIHNTHNMTLRLSQFTHTASLKEEWRPNPTSERERSGGKSIMLDEGQRSLNVIFGRMGRTLMSTLIGFVDLQSYFS